MNDKKGVSCCVALIMCPFCGKVIPKTDLCKRKNGEMGCLACSGNYKYAYDPHPHGNTPIPPTDVTEVPFD